MSLFRFWSILVAIALPAIAGAQATLQTPVIDVPLVRGEERRSVDLDGNGTEEVVFLKQESNGRVLLSVVEWRDGALRDRTGLHLRVLSGVATLMTFKRTDHPTAFGVAVGNTLYSGLPLAPIGQIPDTGNEPAIAVGDVDNDSVLDAITLSATGLSRWRFGDTAPVASITLPDCFLFTSINYCKWRGFFRRSTTMAGDWLLVGVDGLASKTFVLDPTSLTLRQTYDGTLLSLAMGNVDTDADNELVAKRGALFAIYDITSPTALTTFDLESFCNCSVSTVNLLANPNHPGRVALAWSRVGSIRRHDLPSWNLLPDPPGAATGTILGVADVDADGLPNAIVESATFDEPRNAVVPLDDTTLQPLGGATRFKSRILARWRRPSGDELVGVYVIPFNGSLFALNAASGEPVWNYPSVPSDMLRFVRDLKVGQANGDGIEDLVTLTDMSVSAFSGTDRSLMWTHSLVPPQGNARGLNALQIANVDADHDHELILAPTGEPVEVRSAATGALEFTIPASECPPNRTSLVQLDADPTPEMLVRGSNCFVAVDFDTRTVIWRAPPSIVLEGLPTMVYRNRRLEFVSVESGVLKLRLVPSEHLLRESSFSLPNNWLEADPKGNFVFGFGYSIAAVSLDDMVLDSQVQGVPPVIPASTTFVGSNEDRLSIQGAGEPILMEIEVEVRRPVFQNDFEG